MSSSSTRFSDISFPWLIAFAVLLAIWLIWNVARSRARTSAMREYAQMHQMDFLGTVIPRDLRLDKLSVWQSSDSVENLMVGHGENTKVIFDFYAKRGKHSSRQTAIALRSDPRATLREMNLSADNGIFIEKIGEWIVYFVHKQLVAPDSLERFVLEARLSVSDCGSSSNHTALQGQTKPNMPLG